MMGVPAYCLLLPFERAKQHEPKNCPQVVMGMLYPTPC